MNGRSRTVVATTTWNTGTLVDDFLDHYRRLGAAAVLLMDFGSVDGTRERVVAWGDFVKVFDLPSLAGKDSSNALLAEAKRRYPKEWWCLFCDPDEFLVTPRMQIDDASAAALPDAGTIVVERRNMTGPRSIATAQADLSPLRGLTLRIDGRHERTNQEKVDHERRLEPPWIYTAVPGKVLVRLGAAESIGEGDHVAITAAATVRPRRATLISCTTRFGITGSSQRRWSSLDGTSRRTSTPLDSPGSTAAGCDVWSNIDSRASTSSSSLPTNESLS